MKSEDTRHFEAILGKTKFKEEYILNIVQSWRDQLEVLSKIAEILPQNALSAYVYGLKHEFRFFLRAIRYMFNYLLPKEEALRSQFIPAIAGLLVATYALLQKEISLHSQ